jgi:hypothetical protein
MVNTTVVIVINVMDFNPPPTHNILRVTDILHKDIISLI